MSGDDWMRAAYLIVLLAFLLGLFSFGRRRNFGRGLRDVLIWALIFAMVVIAYGFRDVLRDGLFPSGTTQIDARTIELRRLRDGHFHADLRVNGAPVSFLVDTGASRIVLSRRDAQAAGIDTEALAFTGRARSANGEVATAPVRLDSVEFGDLVDRGVPASVNGGALDTSLLGMDYLRSFSRIEIIGDRMLLHF